MTTATPTNQTKPTRWQTPSMGQNGGGRALLSPGDWATTRWMLPWTLGRWDHHTVLCYEQLFTCSLNNNSCVVTEKCCQDVTEGRYDLLVWGGRANQKCFCTIFFLSTVLFCSLFVLRMVWRKWFDTWCFIRQISQRFCVTAWASSPQSAVIMWIMCCSCMLAKIHSPFGRQICFHHDPCLRQKFGSPPMKLHLTLNYPWWG